MLLNRLFNVPRTAHAGGERREVTLRDRYRLASVARGDGHLTFQQVARFGRTVCPRKLRRRTPPRAPVEDAGWTETDGLWRTNEMEAGRIEGEVYIAKTNNVSKQKIFALCQKQTLLDLRW